MHSLDDIQSISFPRHAKEDSFLVIYESGKTVPFLMHRVFVIDAETACERGEHAHRLCTQIMVVLRGECTITCDDGMAKQSFTLKESSNGLLIPPGLWAGLSYQPKTLLMVLTDIPFDEAEYIRDYRAFLDYRNN